jgi:hypothetical protein
MSAGSEQPRLPSDPTFALALAMLYRRLGGEFLISGNGRRGYYQPCYGECDELPQLPDAEPDERFHSVDEWSGAAKLVRGLLRRLGDADSNLVFDLLADGTIDLRKLAPSIEEPRIWTLPC